MGGMNDPEGFWHFDPFDVLYDNDDEHLFDKPAGKARKKKPGTVRVDYSADSFVREVRDPKKKAAAANRSAAYYEILSSDETYRADTKVYWLLWLGFLASFAVLVCVAGWFGTRSLVVYVIPIFATFAFAFAIPLWHLSRLLPARRAARKEAGRRY